MNSELPAKVRELLAQAPPSLAEDRDQIRRALDSDETRIVTSSLARAELTSTYRGRYQIARDHGRPTDKLERIVTALDSCAHQNVDLVVISNRKIIAGMVAADGLEELVTLFYFAKKEP